VSKRYSKRTSSRGLVHPIPEPKRCYGRRINKLTCGLQNPNNQELEIVENIRCLFESNPSNPVLIDMAAPWLDDIYQPLDFSRINGAPHDIPENAVDSIPTFQGNNVASALDHLAKFRSVTFRIGVA
jgi:hypothetical protein